MTEQFIERDRVEGDIRHGTTSGATWHSRNGVPLCDACRAAKAEYDKRWLAADSATRRNRLHAMAQQRALRDLKNAHPDEYRVAYLAHKTALFEQDGANR